MTDLPLKDVREMSLDAVRSIAGSQAGDAEVAIGLDSSDELVYYITLQLEPGQHSILSPADRIRISHKIRDALIEAGDERYPHLRFLSRDDWDARNRARSR
ncbi:MAG: hypothetical protein INR70_29745 [Parafilimonas terrae]|nr:hypothetical protein [Parafilimonas terrae]